MSDDSTLPRLRDLKIDTRSLKMLIRDGVEEARAGLPFYVTLGYVNGEAIRLVVETPEEHEQVTNYAVVRHTP